MRRKIEALAADLQLIASTKPELLQFLVTVTDFYNAAEASWSSIGLEWCGRRDLNPGPLARKASVLRRFSVVFPGKSG